MTGWTKSVRALFAALITTLLALLMHLGAGGSASLPATGVVLVLWMAMIFAGRRRGYLSLTALLGLGQVPMHLTMSWSALGHSGSHSGGHSASAGEGAPRR
ncbi:hypothetical protein [Brevibacterium spongiae]|uniref:Uncharacterized protein n=1 Tax=Brevibacterium spongiae TaxID=2909672 RepID=A0ABY5SNY6_9MICO|nr:hypothetical protein [Brevibacterium spongiae]UVI35879.1 hypothetical protein L1F31_17465 [Brevibacterium spongiae]